jgi:hypothetical protein
MHEHRQAWDKSGVHSIVAGSCQVLLLMLVKSHKILLSRGHHLLVRRFYEDLHYHSLNNGLIFVI